MKYIYIVWVLFVQATIVAMQQQITLPEKLCHILASDISSYEEETVKKLEAILSQDSKMRIKKEYLTVPIKERGNKVLLDFLLPNVSIPTKTLHGHTGWINKVCFSHDGTLVASCSHDKSIKLWDVETGECTKTLPSDNGVYSISFNPYDNLASSDENIIKLWDVKTGVCIHTLSGHADTVLHVNFNSNGTCLASSSFDKAIILWSTKRSKIFWGHTDFVNAVDVNRDNTLLASCSDDRSIKLWDIEIDKCIETLFGHTHWVLTVCFSHDGTLLASGSYDESIKLWNVDKGRCIQTLSDNASAVHAVNFNPDDTLLVSSSGELIKLWSVATGGCMRTLLGHHMMVHSVNFSSNGMQLVSGARDKSIKIWDIKPLLDMRATLTSLSFEKLKDLREKYSKDTSVAITTRKEKKCCSRPSG